jgi:hypothetical protein
MEYLKIKINCTGFELNFAGKESLQVQPPPPPPPPPLLYN